MSNNDQKCPIFLFGSTLDGQTVNSSVRPSFNLAGILLVHNPTNFYSSVRRFFFSVLHEYQFDELSFVRPTFFFLALFMNTNLTNLYLSFFVPQFKKVRRRYSFIDYRKLDGRTKIRLSVKNNLLQPKQSSSNGDDENVQVFVPKPLLSKNSLI